MSQAKILNDTELLAILRACSQGRYAARNRVLVLLSFKAGLRACEISRLRRWHLLTPSGAIDTHIHLDKTVVKGGLKLTHRGRPRTVPISAELRRALEEYFAVQPGTPRDPVVLSERADTMPTENDMPAPMLPRTIVRIFRQLYDRVGLCGCRSHSGRRTFGTKAARLITQAGGSLKDVQELLGHADLATTQRYIEGTEDAKRRVVDLL